MQNENIDKPEQYNNQHSTAQNNYASRTERTWSIKRTGKGFYIICLFLIFYLVIVLFVLLSALRYQTLSISSFYEIFIGPLISFPLLWLAWLSVFPATILRKKIPTQITVKPYQTGITLIFPKKKSLTLSVAKFAFCIHKKRLYNVLIFYKIIQARRGHLVFQKITAIIGLKFGAGWKKETLTEIANYLHKNGYQYHKTKDKNLFLRFIE